MSRAVTYGKWGLSSFIHCLEIDLTYGYSNIHKIVAYQLEILLIKKVFFLKNIEIDEN